MNQQPSWTPYPIFNLNIMSHNDSTIFRIDLYGDQSLNDLTNTLILDASIVLFLKANIYF